MNDSRRDPGAPLKASPETTAEADAAVRFRGIVDSEATRPVDDSREARLRSHVAAIESNAREWNAASRQVWQVSRLAAVFIFFAMVVGWPLGDFLAYLHNGQTEAGWSPFAAFTTWTLMFAIIVPVLILICGYLLSRTMTMMNAAESIAAAARQFIQPDETAVYNAELVGTAVRGQMDALNQSLDGALTRLASVEAMIRRHVQAIEVAGDAIENHATGAVEQVASERARLMELTESLNVQADSFAAAIAAKAQASIEALQSAEGLSERAEAEFEDRLVRLETAAHRALESFDALREALSGADETVRASASAIETSAGDTVKASEKAAAAAEAAARAAETARTSSQEAIDAAIQEAGRMADAAVEATAREAAKVSEATGKALEDIRHTSTTAIESASDDASKASAAADEVGEAARKASEAAAKASADIAAASQAAQKSAEAAISQSDDAAGKVEERSAALAKAREALEKENSRLENLIDEQRKRADRLADVIAEQTGRLSKLAETQLREEEAARRAEAAPPEPAPPEPAPTSPAENPRPSRPRPAGDAKPAAARTAASKPVPAVGDKPPARRPAAKPADDETGVLNLSLPTGRAKPKPAPAETDARSESARLDAMARDIAERRNGTRREPPVTTEKTAAKGSRDRRDKHKVTWREILDAAEDAEPLDLAAAAKPAAPSKPAPGPSAARPPQEEEADAIRIIGRLQTFTRDLETRLYGDPPSALVERFDMGDRNVFANRLLRLNETDVKRRIRTESGRDKGFEHDIHEFLQGFEKLLEDATTSETADEDLEEYLSSPLGRVYLLIGATVGYFA